MNEPRHDVRAGTDAVGLGTPTQFPNNPANATFYCLDEMYCDWFICPACNSKEIAEGSNFCPNCGIRVVCGQGSEPSDISSDIYEASQTEYPA